MYTFVRDVLMFPQDPLGPRGPSLERFLRFPPPSTQPQPQTPESQTSVNLVSEPVTPALPVRTTPEPLTPQSKSPKNKKKTKKKKKLSQKNSSPSNDSNVVTSTSSSCPSPSSVQVTVQANDISQGISVEVSQNNQGQKERFVTITTSNQAKNNNKK